MLNLSFIKTNLFFIKIFSEKVREKNQQKIVETIPVTITTEQKRKIPCSIKFFKTMQAVIEGIATYVHLVKTECIQLKGDTFISFFTQKIRPIEHPVEVTTSIATAVSALPPSINTTQESGNVKINIPPWTNWYRAIF
ncbi:MAG: hypothetical protein PHF76_11000, partial [Bacteroidales bacterium]|nr:hypothetical protein [Bacteroidales bacterium]